MQAVVVGPKEPEIAEDTLIGARFTINRSRVHLETIRKSLQKLNLPGKVTVLDNLIIAEFRMPGYGYHVVRQNVRELAAILRRDLQIFPLVRFPRPNLVKAILA